MFGSTLRRENRALTEKLKTKEADLRAARLDCGRERREKAEWNRRAERFGNDRIATERRATRLQITAADLSAQLADWSSHAVDQAELFGRALRVRRTESRRLHAVIGRQSAELRALNERLAAQENQLSMLQAANEAHYRDLAARPAKARVQRGPRLEMAS